MELTYHQINVLVVMAGSFLVMGFSVWGIRTGLKLLEPAHKIPWYSNLANRPRSVVTWYAKRQIIVGIIVLILGFVGVLLSMGQWVLALDN